MQQATSIVAGPTVAFAARNLPFVRFGQSAELEPSAARLSERQQWASRRCLARIRSAKFP